MTSIKIKDTGKYSTTSSVVSGEKLAPGDNGVAGTLLTLKGVEINASYGVLTNDSPIPLKKKSNISTEAFEYGEADSAGVELPEWTVSGIIKCTNEEDMKTLGRLIYFTKTKGYKELYAPLDNVRTDLISYSKYGEKEAAGIYVKIVDFVNVRVKSLVIRQASTEKLLKYTLNLVETI